MGLGSIGGGSQTLFGGSGGQDIFQKTTWVLGALFMVSSLGLSLMRSKNSRTLSSVKKVQTVTPVDASLPAEQLPTE